MVDIDAERCHLSTFQKRSSLLRRDRRRQRTARGRSMFALVNKTQVGESTAPLDSLYTSIFFRFGQVPIRWQWKNHRHSGKEQA